MKDEINLLAVKIVFDGSRPERSDRQQTNKVVAIRFILHPSSRILVFVRYTNHMDWQENIITRDSEIRDLLKNTRTIAVLGIKTEAQSTQPAFYVPNYLKSAGFEVIPVPVYYPEATEILGEKVYRSLAEIPGEVDMVNVFRRSQDVTAHVDDILARKPKSVWMQLGISNAAAAEKFAKAGIKVVENRCLMVDHRYLG
jgi:uncharacterized protein